MNNINKKLSLIIVPLFMLYSCNYYAMYSSEKLQIPKTMHNCEEGNRVISFNGEIMFGYKDNILYKENLYNGSSKSIILDHSEKLISNLVITKTGVGLLFYESSEMYAEKVDKKVYFIEFDLWLNSTDTTIFHTVHQFPLLKEDFNYTSCYASLNKDTFIFNSPYGNCQFVYDLIWTPRLNSYTYVDVLTGIYYKQSMNESVQLNSSVGEYWVISNVNSKFEHFSIVKNMLFYNTPLGIKVFDLKKRENIEFNYNDKELDASLRIEDGIYYESNKFVTIIRKVRK